MTTLQQMGNAPAAFIRSCVDPNMSYEEITVSGGKFAAGAVLSKDGNVWGVADAGSSEHCILYRAVDASTADQQGLGVMRLVAVKADHLEWPPTMSAPDKTAILAALKAVNIIAIEG